MNIVFVAVLFSHFIGKAFVIENTPIRFLKSLEIRPHFSQALEIQQMNYREHLFNSIDEIFLMEMHEA